MTGIYDCLQEIRSLYESAAEPELYHSCIQVLEQLSRTDVDSYQYPGLEDRIVDLLDLLYVLTDEGGVLSPEDDIHLQLALDDIEDMTLPGIDWDDEDSMTASRQANYVEDEDAYLRESGYFEDESVDMSRGEWEPPLNYYDDSNPISEEGFWSETPEAPEVEISDEDFWV